MKRTSILIALIITVSLSAFGQRGNQKWFNTAIGMRIEGGAATVGTLGPSYERALTTTTSLELMLLSNFSTGIEAVGMYKLIKTIPDVPPFVRWYMGFGAHAGIWRNSVYAGPDFLLGIGYSFSDFPVNVCIDWHPNVDIGHSFNAAKFGFSVRYIVE